MYATQTLQNDLSNLNRLQNQIQFAHKTLDLPSVPVTKSGSNVLVIIENSEF